MASTGLNSSDGPESAVERADIVVGIISHNDVETIGGVIGAVRNGLARGFRQSVTRLVLADAGSTDATRQTARDAAAPSTLVELDYERGPAFAVLPYHGKPGRVAALRAILGEAQRVNAAACAVIDASIRTLQAEWVEGLIGPVLTDGFDYVSPFHARHVHEGAVTKGIVSPMFRALYGVRLRQPAAGEFGCSARLARHLLDQDFWDRALAPGGIDLWLAVAAVCGDFRTCEVALGTRSAASRGVTADLSTTLVQVVGALFSDLERRVDVWQRVRTTATVPVFGIATPPDTDPPLMHHEALTESFRLGYRELREVWTWVLPPRTIVELKKLTDTAPDRLHFDDRLWARVVYDFAAAHAFRVLPHDHLLRSLTPLYSGWLASFVLQNSGASPEEVDARLEALCLAFESEKRHLIARWRWPERLR